MYNKSLIIEKQIKLLELESIKFKHLPNRDVSYLQNEITTTKFELKQLMQTNKINSITVG